MFEKFSRSWALVKASAELLRSDRELLLFPVISGAATLLVLATFLVRCSRCGSSRTASESAARCWVSCSISASTA